MQQLRTYNETDLQQVIGLFLLNTPAWFCPGEQQDLEQYLHLEIEHYFVIEEEGKILATGGSNILDDTGRLSWYLVHPAHHGKGLGRQLALHNLEILKSNTSVHNIEVRTSQLVYPFYEKLGFELIFTKDNFWGEGMHLYHMKWKQHQ